LLGAPAGALADAHVELEALWGRRAVELRERLCAAPHSQQRFQILEQALIELLPGTPNTRGEVEVALARLGWPGVEVAQLARDVQLSHRRLIELFTEQVGLTPKRFARVRRFQRALALAASRESQSWTELALECGYYDQAHLCHDWLEFTGVSPMEFFRLRSVPVKANHLAVPEVPGSRAG
jgi:AraC-like DNA-binding protein